VLRFVVDRISDAEAATMVAHLREARAASWRDRWGRRRSRQLPRHAGGRRRCTGSKPSTIASAGTRPSTCRVRSSTRSGTGIAAQRLNSGVYPAGARPGTGTLSGTLQPHTWPIAAVHAAPARPLRHGFVFDGLPRLPRRECHQSRSVSPRRRRELASAVITAPRT